MKLKSIFFVIGCYLLTIGLFGGCAKETTTKVETTSNSVSQNAIAMDEVTLNNEFDQFVDDAITVLGNHNATIAGMYPPDSVSPGIIELTYNGKTEPDGTKIRSGSDSIHYNPGVLWNTPGATATISFGDVNAPGYEVTFSSNNPSTSVRFNGTVTLINKSGGLLQNLAIGDSLVEIIKGSLTYTFDDNAATIVYYPFNLNQIRSIKNTGSALIASTWADTAIGGLTNVCNWGLDRFGNAYYTSITGTIVQNISTYTLSYNPLKGSKNIQNITEPILSVYGVNQQGTVITSGTPYGFIITWDNNGGQAQSVIGYYY